jgi:hypothetical protein
MSRVRSLEGRDAGVVATTIQGLFRLLFGRALNPTKVQAHSSRILLSSFLSNAILGSSDGVSVTRRILRQATQPLFGPGDR